MERCIIEPRVNVPILMNCNASIISFLIFDFVTLSLHSPTNIWIFLFYVVIYVVSSSLLENTYTSVIIFPVIKFWHLQLIFPKTLSEIFEKVDKQWSRYQFDIRVLPTCWFLQCWVKFFAKVSMKYFRYPMETKGLCNDWIWQIIILNRWV